nr:hypothetical protein [Tanacetum cinerariifolium]
LHWSGVGAAPLMSPRQDETSKPLLYARWMVGPYRCKDATWGRNDDPVTSGVGAAPPMSPRQDETSDPLLYAGWMAGPYRVEDATRGRNDDPVTSGIKSQVGPRRTEAESFKLFSEKVLKSVGCAKVAGAISRDVKESI